MYSDRLCVYKRPFMRENSQNIATVYAWITLVIHRVIKFYRDRLCVNLKQQKPALMIDFFKNSCILYQVGIYRLIRRPHEIDSLIM